MPRPPRFPAPDRPDLEARLLGAVAERDGSQAWRLADQLVHRRGVSALERLIGQTVPQRQGVEARDWLAGLVGMPIPQSPAASLEVGAQHVAEVQAEPLADPLDQAAWLEDLAREEDLLAGILSAATAQPAPFSPVHPEPLSPDPEPLIPRLMAVSPSPASAEGTRRVPAPAPAALARLRAWLHDDDAVPEAS